MEIPNELKIGGHTYTIIKAPSLDHGGFEPHELKIYIRPDLPSLMEETLLHEILHAVRHLTGTEHEDEKEDERQVNIQALALYQILKDNKLI